MHASIPHRRTARHVLSMAARLVCTSGLLAAPTLAPASPPTVPKILLTQAPEATVPTRTFNVAAGPLAQAINQFAQQAGVFVSGISELAQGRRSAGLRGDFTVAGGFEALLQDTGLEAIDQANGGFTLRHMRTEPSSRGAANTLPEVVVTTAAPGNAGTLPDVYAGGQVATGSRIGLLGNRDVMDTPFSVTSYTSEFIANQQARSVMEALRNEPSVRDIFPEGGLGEYFNMRGFYMQSHEFAWNGLYGLVPHNRTSTELLERVEVLRGPGALLNGMSLGGGVGGVINLVPKRAGDLPLTRVTTGLASDANLSVHLDMARRYGDERQFGARINVLKSHGDAAVDNQTEDRQLGAVALDYRGRQLRAAIDIYHIKEEQSGGLPLMTTLASTDIPAAPDPTTNTVPGAYGISRSKAVAGSVEYDFNDQWTGFAALGTKRQRGQGYLNNALGMNAQASGDYVGVGMNVDNFFDVVSADAGLRGRFETGPVGHSLTLSANAVEQKSGALAGRSMWASNIYVPTLPVAAASPGTAPKSTETTLSGLAIADTLSFAQDRYQLTLGLRQQRVRSRNFNATGGTRYDKSALTPTIAVVARPWTAPVSVYANYIEGLSQGGSVSDASADNYGEVFSPYKSKQLELGLKWDTGRFMNTVSVFQIKRPSVIKNQATNTYGPDGEQRNRGIEWSSAGELGDGLRLLGGVARLQAVTTRTNGGTLDGKDASGIPHWQANLGAEWDTPWLPGLSLSATSIYTGSQFADDANTQKLPSWTRFDLGARYATRLAGKNVVLRGNVVNAFDKRYWSGVWNGYVSVGAPRTYRLSVQVDF
ncbi:TonB-dependent receptor [Corticibacter populi]|nr:TonB-dependent receptor [Corticibacter populi]RZS32025.1 iron complex outermembrane receptor protein [Corticibacter populi]